jgi:hypothetical protein
MQTRTLRLRAAAKLASIMCIISDEAPAAAHSL